MSETDGIQILDGVSGPELAIVEGEGVARAIVWPGIGAHLRSLHRVWLGPAGRMSTLSHYSEAVYYVVEGAGAVADPSTGEAQPLRRGSMFHVEAGTPYAVRADEAGMQLVGGPSPADPRLYVHLADEGH